MAFDFAAKRLVWIKVNFPGSVGKGDGVAKPTTHSIEVKVELIDRDSFKAMYVRPDDTDPVGQAAFDNRTEIEKFKSVAEDWRGVKNGEVDAPFTDENIAAMLVVPNFGDGFNRAYLAAWQGQEAIRAGN